MIEGRNPSDLPYSARTDAELARLSDDLPATAPAVPRSEVADPRAGRTDWMLAVMGSDKRRGRWRVRNRTQGVALLGAVDLDLDLGEAELPSGDVEITAWAIMGGIDVRVPEGVRVELGGFAVMGGNGLKGPADPPRPGAPVVRVRAYSVMGAVTVRRKRLREIRDERRLRG